MLESRNCLGYNISCYVKAKTATSVNKKKLDIKSSALLPFIVNGQDFGT